MSHKGHFPSVATIPFFAAVAVALAAVPAEAGTKNFMAVLNAGQEVPPITSSSAIGNAFMTFDTSTSELCYAISYVGLIGNETATHFHGPASPGVDAAIVAGVSPDVSPLGSPKNGCVTLDKDGAKALKKGQLYINVHSDAGPDELGGEIRGQVVPVKGK
jgi:hypothetical protein